MQTRESTTDAVIIAAGLHACRKRSQGSMGN